MQKNIYKTIGNGLIDTFDPPSELIFVRILIPYINGIILFYNFKSFRITLALLLLSCTIFICLLLSSIYYRKLKAYHFKSLTGITIYLLFFIAGGLCCHLNMLSLKSDYYANHRTSYLKVMVNDEPQLKGRMIRFKAMVISCIQPASKAVSGLMIISIRLDSLTTLKLEYGDEIIIPANYRLIAAPANPAEFDFKSWMASQNIHHQSFLKQQQVLKLHRNTGNRIIAYALQVRKRQVERYRKLIKNDEAFAVAATLILGYKSDLSDDILDIYAKTGTIHALSVSGMHVGLIYVVLQGLLSFLSDGRYLKIVKMIFILTVIWYYSLLTGFSPSVLRSVIMLSVFIAAKTFARQTNPYNIVAFTAFCILLYNPFLIWDIGFQLSFLAVIGLIYLPPKIRHCVYIEHKWINKLWDVVCISLSAQLFTFPFSIYYFHQFPVYFLLSNLFIVIPMTLLMYLGILILLLRLDFAGPIFEWLISFTNTGLAKIAKLPFSGLSDIWISKIELLLLCISLSLLMLAISNLHKKLLLIALTTFMSLQCLCSYGRLKAYYQQKVIHFKIPKGNAIAYISSHHAIIYTNLRPDHKSFRYYIRPALSQHQITSIKCVPIEKEDGLLYGALLPLEYFK